MIVRQSRIIYLYFHHFAVESLYSVSCLQPLADTLSGGIDEVIPSARLPSVELSPSSSTNRLEIFGSSGEPASPPGEGDGAKGTSCEESKQDTGRDEQTKPSTQGKHGMHGQQTPRLRGPEACTGALSRRLVSTHLDVQSSGVAVYFVVALYFVVTMYPQWLRSC